MHQHLLRIQVPVTAAERQALELEQAATNQPMCQLARKFLVDGGLKNLVRRHRREQKRR